VTASLPSRGTTAQAWQRAAQRALAADLPHQLRQRGGSVLVPSLSSEGVHRVQLVEGRAGQCDCVAGVHGRPCKHRAAVALRLAEREAGIRVTGVKSPAVVQRFVVGA
jgi:uncharacterized Zn finger protein